MGMDVFGKAPLDPGGHYFRRNVWGWHPLAELVQAIAPEETGRCRYWHSNDGDGLDAEDSAKVADKLDAALAQGVVDKMIEARRQYLLALPNETCNWCEGTGIRSDDVGVDVGMPEHWIGEGPSGARVEIAAPDHPRYGQQGWCNVCSGRGWSPHSETHYRVDTDDVREFSSFLRACGGFEIR